MNFRAFGILCIISGALAASTGKSARDSERCDISVCSGGACYCSRTESPLAVEETPQLITLAFTDAVTQLIYTNYWLPMLDGRTNPDGKQVGATFYVPHEYTDYEAVNDLYNIGLEIGVHSISKNSLSSYWSSATVDTLIEEFYGQRQLIAKFANIPIEDVVGARIPNLEMAGDNMFEAYQQSGIEFDNSWTALSSSRYFPYTLDYLSSQRCIIGTCPTESYPGIWEMPVINLEGANYIQCNSLQACGVSGDAEEVSTWLIGQFEDIYRDNRVPLTLTVTSAWFDTSENNFVGFLQFLDYLRNYDDVFLVSHKQVMDWMKDPVPASSYETTVENRSQSCVARTCELLKDGVETRYMRSCVSCPLVYPWLGNPLGGA